MSDAVRFEQVFADELRIIEQRRATAGVKPDPRGSTPERAFDLRLRGLAFSGGGIRSASFNLGVLQALAKNGILEQCDYLSTVSGGGYIGSCLSSLCAGKGADVTPEGFPFRFDGKEERPEVKRLRQHGDYLAPVGGLFSIGTWRVASTYLGRLMVTLLTVVCVLGASAAAGIIIYPRIVNLVLEMLGRPTVRAFGIWYKPTLHLTELFAPALAIGAVWLLTSLAYAAVAVVPRLWNIGFRRRLTSIQAWLLRLGVFLAVAGALPIFLWWVKNTLLPEFKLVASIPAALSLASLAGSKLLGQEAKTIPAVLKRWLVAAGTTLFVVIFCLTVLYLVLYVSEDTVVVLVVLTIGLVLLSLFTDINRVSMHYFYRDRLSEAFIFRRKPPPQAGSNDGAPTFESNDALALSELRQTDRRVPYHLVNTCVNFQGSKDEVLRGRKSDLFLLSPLYCGSRATGYRPTEIYENGRISLASAMAVSGAAASPQHGFGSSSALAFLMTLLNVRLGIWAENPRFRPGRAGGLLSPRRLWPVYLCRELFNSTNERSWLINLSDGGHIENLAVYELLRRRCKVIIASDAEADPNRTFGGLGGVIRKARIDMGIEILMDDIDKLVPDKETRLSELHAVTGAIRYPRGDGAFEAGTLIYIKSALTKGDPRDLHEYRCSHDTFPHESTADQFFDEAQFESYRELGYRSGKAAAALMGVKAARPSISDAV